MEITFFYIIIGLSLLSSVAFEMNGVYALFGISVYFFLTILIASSKVYISFYNKSFVIIGILSLVTSLFASLDVINHYIESNKESSLQKESLLDLQKALDLNRQQQQALIKREESFNKTLSYGYSPKSILLSSKDNTDSLKELQQEEKELTTNILYTKERTTFNPFKSLITLIFILSNELILAYLLIQNKKRTPKIKTQETLVEKKVHPFLEILKNEVPTTNPLIININKIDKDLVSILLKEGYITSKNNHLYATNYKSIVSLSKEG